MHRSVGQPLRRRAMIFTLIGSGMLAGLAAATLPYAADAQVLSQAAPPAQPAAPAPAMRPQDVQSAPSPVGQQQGQGQPPSQPSVAPTETAVGTIGTPQTTQQASTVVCPESTAAVVDAYKVPKNQSARDAAEAKIREVELDDVIALMVERFDTLIAERDCRGRDKRIVLFLSGRPMTALTAFPPTDPSSGVVHFTLRRSDNSREAWAYILGRPHFFEVRPVDVSLGIEDQYAMPSQAVLNIRIVPLGWLLAWAAIFVAMVGAFFWCVRRSNILRDGRPDPDSGTWTDGTYSLAKSQAAWWFFVVLASYLLIGMITGDFSTTMNGTVITLLGIGAGTIVLSAVIDSSKSTADNTSVERAAAAKLQARIKELEASITQLDSNTSGDPGDLAKIAAQRQELSEVKSIYKKVSSQSEGFFTDIVSDVNGVSFHRFQIAAWTIVLSVIFVKEVYQNLAMPNFDATLLTLQGISAGTYLGLKNVEPIIPQKT